MLQKEAVSMLLIGRWACRNEYWSPIRYTLRQAQCPAKYWLL